MSRRKDQRDIEWGLALVFDRNGEPISPAARASAGLPPCDPPPGKRWVDVLDFDLDYSSLADAYMKRYEHESRNAGSYWRRRVELLEELLGVALDPRRLSPSWEARCEALQTLEPVDGSIRARAEWNSTKTWSTRVAKTLCGIAVRAIRLHATISSPLDTGQLEGLPHPFERELRKHHVGVFVALDEGVRAACRALVADVIRTLHPDVVGRRVRMTQLFDRGLEWWPPDDDLL